VERMREINLASRLSRVDSRLGSEVYCRHLFLYPTCKRGRGLRVTAFSFTLISSVHVCKIAQISVRRHR
jgi:hypothetical protein